MLYRRQQIPREFYFFNNSKIVQNEGIRMIYLLRVLELLEVANILSLVPYFLTFCLEEKQLAAAGFEPQPAEGQVTA